MSSEDDFQQQDDGAYTYPAQAGTLKKGDIMLIKDKPCKVVEISTCKTGKHGHAKVNITAADLFSGKTAEDSVSSSHNIDMVNVSKKEYDLTNLDGEGVATLMDEKGEYREDLIVDNESELFTSLKEAFDKSLDIICVVMSAMGVERIVSFRVDKKD